MSFKIQLNENDFSRLDNAMVLQIENSATDFFAREAYLTERYARTAELKENRIQQDNIKSRPLVALEKRLVDTAVGYGMNKPITYYDITDDNIEIEKKKNIIYGIENSIVKKKKEQENGEYLKSLLAVLKDNYSYTLDVELYRKLLITGTADEMIYTDEDGEIQIAELNGCNCIAIYDYSIKPKMIGFIRIIVQSSINNNDKKIYEVYTKDKSWRFSDGDNEELNMQEPIIIGGQNVNPIPFVRYEINESFVESIIPLVRSYELVVENTKNMLNYNDQALLMIRGYLIQEGEDPDAVVRQIKESGSLFLDSEGDTGASWLTKSIDDNAIMNQKATLKDDIYADAGIFDPANDNAVYQNTLSLLFKLYSLETKTGQFLGEIKKSITKRIAYITNILNYKGNTDYNYKNIDMTFTRDIPTNINEELNFLTQASPFLSQRTLYERLSFIENPEKEMQRYEEWQYKQAEIEAKSQEIVNKALAETMPYDLNYRGEDDKNSNDEENPNDPEKHLDNKNK